MNKSIWFELRVRRQDQPNVTPEHIVTRFSYRNGDVVAIPMHVRANQDEPVRGEKKESVVRKNGAVKAQVAIADASLPCIVQLLGWPDGADDSETQDIDERWTVLEEKTGVKGNVTIGATFPPWWDSSEDEQAAEDGDA